MRRSFTCLLLLMSGAAAFADKDSAFFDKRVAPILTRRCLGCHNNELKDGNISFLDRASLVKAIVPGKPESSVLIKAIRHDGDVRMPPGPKLSARDISVLTEWIARGAVWGKKLR